MASAMKKCRVCGKEYEACRSAMRNPDVFRWQEVACSPECGAEYLRQIAISRGEVPDDIAQSDTSSADTLDTPAFMYNATEDKPVILDELDEFNEPDEEETDYEEM